METTALSAVLHPNYPAARLRKLYVAMLSFAVMVLLSALVYGVQRMRGLNDSPTVLAFVLGGVALVLGIAACAHAGLYLVATGRAAKRMVPGNTEKYAWAAVKPRPLPLWALLVYGLLGVLAVVAAATLPGGGASNILLFAMFVPAFVLKRHAEKAFREVRDLIDPGMPHRALMKQLWTYAARGPEAADVQHRAVSVRIATLGPDGRPVRGADGQEAWHELEYVEISPSGSTTTGETTGERP